MQHDALVASRARLERGQHEVQLAVGDLQGACVEPRGAICLTLPRAREGQGHEGLEVVGQVHGARECLARFSDARLVASQAQLAPGRGQVGG